MGKPGGGPIDEEPPQILLSFPETGATKIDPKTKFEITFSEAVDHNTFAEALFISPVQDEKPDISWRGKTVRIALNNPIQDNQTVVITVGSGLRDLRNNNLTESFSFAVSTGDRLDQGTITGRVFDSKPVQGMLIGTWSVQSDSILDPVFSKPRYMTQVSEDGAYKLEYLPGDIYRVMCWDDKNRDHKCDPGVDRIGFPWQDITLPQDSLASMNFQPTRIDTGKVQFLFASPSDQHHVNLRMNRNPQWNSDMILGMIHIEDSTGRLEISGAWYDAKDSTRIVLRTAKQQAENEYRILFSGDSVQIVFKGEVRPDTIPPVITFSIPSKDSRDIEENIDGILAFDDAMADHNWESILQLSIVDSMTVPITAKQIGPNRIGWGTKSALPFDVKCELKLDLTKVFDVSGNPGANITEFTEDSTNIEADSLSSDIQSKPSDTEWVNYFSIIDPVKTGSISGKVDGVDSGRVLIAARSDRNNAKDKLFVRPKNNGNYQLKYLNPGGYLIWAFEDRNGDAVFSPGTLMPFKFCERFVFYEDTVQVRKRWDSGGVNLNFH